MPTATANGITIAFDDRGYGRFNAGVLRLLERVATLGSA